MIDNIGLMASYGGIGLGILVVGFFVLDALTPGKLGTEIMARNANAALLATASLVSLGLILWFAMVFGGAGYSEIDDFLVYGLVGVAMQAVGFIVLDLLTPGKLGDICRGRELEPGTWVAAGVQVAVALIVAASLT